ncbi:glycosyltransferase family 2 protein [Paenibacillus sp. BT-177]|uniref:glycosyltransferase family 2 protein n=1 Tax=Paenibacillus sp. BT-177 TaxID=2986930 RepID=UPI0021F7734E|nr:glycosyltransferase family 2 protein [Paenibacillus sp. BT-177]
MLVSIVILTLNNWKLTERCLDSIVRYTTIPYELICIDNGSTDGTQHQLRRRENVRLIENETNRGFAAACNQGIKASIGDTILLLNNDTMVSHHWLENLIHALFSSADIGIVGPVSNMVMPMQRLPMSYSTTETYHEFSKNFNVTNPSLWRDATALSGFCMLFRRQLISQIGYLDEAFPGGGYEDIDFGYRTLKKGLRLLIAGDSHVHHEGNASFTHNSIDIVEWGQRNRRIFLRKWNFNPERLIYTLDEYFFPGQFAAGHPHHRPKDSSLPNGILIRDSKGNIYQIEKGLKRPVESLDTFHALHFRLDRVIQLSDTTVTSIPDGKPLLHNGQLREHFPAVYIARDPMNGMHLISHGLRYPFRDFESFRLLGYEVNESIPLSFAQLETFPIGPPIDTNVFEEHELIDYRLYMGPDHGLYYAEGGWLRPIPSKRELHVFRWHTQPPIPLPTDVFNRSPQGPMIVAL